MESRDAEIAEAIGATVWVPRVSGPVATATLVSPTRAITAHPVNTGVELGINFMDGVILDARVIFSGAGLPVVLEVSAGERPVVPFALDGPFFGAVAESFWGVADEPTHATGRIYNDEGAVDVEFEREYKLSDLPLGAPVVAGGVLVGIIEQRLSARVWRVFSPLTIIEALKRAEAEPAKTDFDEAAFLARLHPSARTAIAHAAATAAAVGKQIHIENLIWGLYRDLTGTTRRLFRAKGLDDGSLLRLLAEAAKQDTAFFQRVAPGELAQIPERTDRVENAFIHAARAAGERGSREIRSRHLLFGALSQTESPVIQALHSRGIKPDLVQFTDVHSIIGHRADTTDGPDLLNIASEARALAAVLAASEVEPPISVGLFGEWGSGKSFFMREMHRQFETIENDARAGKENYCRNIVQIWFNAWHYIDANLWASLAAEVFERLDAELTLRSAKKDKDERAKDRAVLLAENAQSRNRLEQAAREQQELEEELKRIGSRRDDLRDERTVAASLGLRSVYSAAAEAVAQTPEIRTIREEIGKAKDSLKVDEATLREAKGVAGAAKVAWKSRPARVTVLLVILLVILMLAAPILVEYLKSFLLLTTVLLAGFLKYLPAAARGLGAIGRAWRIKENLIATERARRLEELAARENDVAERLAQSKKNYESAVLAIEANDAEMAKLEPQRQISTFIHERRKSTDYTKHLGVIASAHDDFQHLSTLLSKAKGTRSDEKVPTVDRIILYIDDLDRCPEDKVVDVLQAVHLLLAFPLFVVVVGVDSRWLLHSLQRHLKQFTAVEHPGDDELSRALWESTPINYLEKIFQIPFTIRPMRSGAFSTLIDNLALPQDRVAAGKTQQQASAPAPATPPAPRVAVPGPEVPWPPASQAAPPAPVASLPPPAPPDPTPVEYLTLQKWETDFMKLLYPLIPSPRAAKRFVNIYRLMRGMIDGYERAAFSGSEAAQGYRAALLMLAMLAGHPEEASDLLQELVTKRPSNDWWTFVDDYIARRAAEPKSDRWARLKERLAEANDPAKVPTPPCDVFIHWAPDVARFSFYSGRVFATTAAST